jgi:isocitrate dehydrogenase
VYARIEWEEGTPQALRVIEFLAKEMGTHLGWVDASAPIERGLEKTLAQKKGTYDLARQMRGATKLKTSEFADASISNM